MGPVRLRPAELPDDRRCLVGFAIRAEALERLERDLASLRPRRPDTRRGARGERHPGAGGLQRHLQPFECCERAFEMAAGRRIARRKGDAPLGQRGRPRPAADALSSRRGLRSAPQSLAPPRRFPARAGPRRGSRAGGQRPRCRPPRSAGAAGGKRPSRARLSDDGSRRSPPAPRGDPRCRSAGARPPRCGPGGSGARPASPRDGCSGAMTGALQRTERLDEAPLRHLKVALRLEELRPAAATEGDQRSVEMAGHVRLDHVVPSQEALEFARLLAGERHDAADVAEDDRIGYLSGGDVDHRLVERCDAASNSPPRRSPARAAPEPRPLALRRRAAGRPRGQLRRGRASGRVEREPTGKLEPSVDGSGLGVAEQAFRPREPSVAGGLVAHRLEVFTGQPEGDPRCGGRLARLRKAV